jgi:hypothetical protein
MKKTTYIRNWLTIYKTAVFVCLLASGVAALSAKAQPARLVVPSELTNRFGNLSTVYPLQYNDSMRYQQVYAASDFPGPIKIYELAFRVSPSGSDDIEGSLGYAIITLSTTLRGVDKLSTNFDSNTGRDKVVVFNGNMSGSVSPLRPEFEFVVALPTPFEYTPSMGNLLMEVIRDSDPFAPGAELCAQNTTNDAVSRIYSFNSSAANASVADSGGLITRFGYVPGGSLVPPTMVMFPKREIQFSAGLGHVYNVQASLAANADWVTQIGPISGTNMVVSRFLEVYPRYRVVDESTNLVAFSVFVAFSTDYFEVSGQSYELLSSSDLKNWATTTPPAPGRGKEVALYYSTREAANKFFRLRTTTP